MATSFLQVSNNSHTRPLANQLNNTTSPVTIAGFDTTKFIAVTTGYSVTIYDDTTYSFPDDDPNMERALVTAASISIAGSFTLTRPNAKAHTGTPIVALLIVAQHITDHSTAINTLEANNTGVNTGDETTSTIKTKLGVTTLSGSNTGDQDLSSYATTASVTSGLAAKEPTVTAGTSAQYYRGDKTMQTLNQDAVPSGTTNKAYTATEQTKLAAVTGTNTGDETSATIKTKLGITTLSGSNTGDQTLPTALPPNGSASGDLSGSYPSPTVAKINGTSMASLATGIVKNTTTTGVPSIAIASDFPTLNQNTTGTAATITGSVTESQVTNLTTDLSAKAPLASPALTGTPTAPTATGGTNTTQLATTAYVQNAIVGFDDVLEYANLAAFPATGTTGMIYIADDTGFLYRWSGSTYVQVGGGTPADATTSSKGIIQLAGDLAGTAAVPIVTKINGTSLAGLPTGIMKNTTTTGVPSIATAGTDYVVPSGSISGSAATLTTARTIGTLTGDVTTAGSTFNGSANNTNATVLATVNANTGSWGTATSVPTITLNGKGLATAAANTAIQIAESQVTNLTTDLAGKQATLVSATNIKTINGSTLLGSGDLTIAGGSATPAGSNTQIQFNNSSAFGASSNLVWDGTKVGVNYTGATNITTTSLGIGSAASYVSGAITSELTIGARTASSTGLTIVAASGQTADFIKLTDVFGNVALSIPANGIPSFTGGINTGSAGMQVQGGNYYQVKTTGNDFEIYNASGGDVPFYSTSAGQHGIGTASPTANLHLKAGTATANTAPLKLTSGTVLTTTEAGAIEYDGSHLYFTATNGGSRNQLDQTPVSAATFTTSGKVLRREYNVVDYGATGNGTTNDTTSVQNAITAAQATGGIVYFPQGTYLVVLPQITTGNIVLQGAGWKSKILLADSTTSATGQTIGLWVNGASNVIIRDLCIDGNFTNIAKNGTYQTASTLWTPIITKYGSSSVKNYIYAGSGVDQSTYLTYRMPIRITDATNVIVENCLIQNSVSAGILIDASAVDNSQEIIIRNNRVKLTWDNGIYFHKGIRYGSAIGNHVSDTQYAGVTAIYCNDILTSNNEIHDNGPSPSDSAGIEYCGVIRGEITGNTIYNALFEGILLKNTNETGITGGFSNNYVKSYSIKVSDNHIENIHDPRFSSSIAYGINVRSADRSHITGNHVNLSDYGIQVGDVADDTVIEGNHITNSYGYGISVGNSADVTNTSIIGNVIENGADNGIEVFAPANIRNNVIRNNAHQGIDLAAPPTGVPYKTDYIENNYFADNGYNGMQAGAGPGNLAVIKNNEFVNSDYYTYSDGVSNSTTTFTSATGTFAASDVGAVIVITGVGSSSGDTSLTTTISAVGSSTSITLAVATSISRTGATFSVYRQKNVYFDGSMTSTSLTSATAKFTSADVGKTVVLYSTDGPTPSLLSTLTVSSVTSSTVAVLSGAPTSNTGIMFVIKRGYGRQGRAVFIASSSDIHYTGNRSWGMSTENYNKGSISVNSFISNNFDFGSATSNADPIGNPITPIAASQTFTAYPGQKDSVIQMNAASGALNVYLPDTGTVAKGTVYTVKKIDTSTNTVTVNGTSSQTIDGSATAVLNSPKQARTYISDGSNWQDLSAYMPFSLTTTGTSGAATFTAGVLNVPQYAGGGTGITRSVSSISGTTSAGSTASTDYVYNVTATATITLPTAVGNTNRYTITNSNAATTTTIATTSSQTINGSTTAVFTGQYISYDLVSDGANWLIR